MFMCCQSSIPNGKNETLAEKMDGNHQTAPKSQLALFLGMN
jgi:hypothetical protein